MCESRITNDESRNPDVLLERVEKIYSDGRWNGRAAVVFWKDRYYIPFRTGSGHAFADGAIRILASQPGEPGGWTVGDIFGPSTDDGQEGHVLTTPDRMMIYLVLTSPNSPETEGLRTLVTWSDDARTWSEPVQVYDDGFSFWKPASHEGVHYVAADVMTGDPRVDLLKSVDGVNWEKASTIIEGPFTETALLFLRDHTLLAFTRQSKVSVAPPPYTRWTTYDGVKLGGPAAGLVGDTVLVSGRVYAADFPDDQPGPRRTGLFLFDPETKQFHWKMNMITECGGDESYPHFWTLDDNRALMVWYSGEDHAGGVPKRADLLLATLRVMA